MRRRRTPIVAGARPRKRQRRLEDIEQLRLATWLDTRLVDGSPLLWAHVPNGGKRHIAIARQLRAAGVKSGVPDVLIFDPPPLGDRRVGVALELKQPDGGSASKNQERWLEGLGKRGWVTLVCHGAESAKLALMELGY